ncbi:Protein of unknown function, partial [Cotesia congregata]
DLTKGKDTKGLSILSLNVNSLLGHLGQLVELISNIKPFIIIMVETWLKPDIDNSIFEIDGYRIFRRDRNLVHAESGRFMQGGGVACFIHNSLKVKVLHTSTAEDINSPEFMILDITMTTGSHLLLSCVYRRPNGHTLCNYINFKTFIYESSLFCVPFETTHHTRNHDSWLDSDAPFIAGHDYLYCEYLLNPPKSTDKLITFRNFKNCDHISLSNALTKILKCSDDFINNSDPNELLEYFLKNVLDTLDVYAPIVTRKITRNSNTWITNELKEKCRERDAIYKRAKRSGDSNLLKLFKLKRKELKSKLNMARENYLKNELTNLPTGHTVWIKLKRLGLIKSNPSSPLNYFDSSALNEFYANIVRRHPPCDTSFLDTLPLLYTSKVRCSFNWTPIDIVDVTKALHLTLSKSKGKNKTIVMILGSVDYCSVVLVDSNVDTDLKLQRAINSIIRYIFSLKQDEHITPYRQKLNWLSIKKRRVYFLATFFYKLLHTGQPSYLRELFVEDSSRRSQRLAEKINNVNFEIPNYTSSFYENSFVVSVIRLWQNLPTNLINSSSLDCFKPARLDHLLKSDFD